MIPREELLSLAREVALHAHCPYSHFRVGAAVVAGGNAYVGVNVEISSYGLTLCAERSALAAAIAAGVVEGSITQVAVACIDVQQGAPIQDRTPCGACRQWLADLAPHAVIYVDGDMRDFKIEDLMPFAFGHKV
ncbi:MAG TPA: cytidine deaminase [Ktedonobacteraceae bacterium]|nr:cytidine deaminase [Ktedonobacteraceae bacterium]